MKLRRKKMKTNKLFTAGLTLLATSMITGTTSHAQNEKGNGGRVWVCYEPKDPITGKRAIKKVELVDYVEARSITAWDINLGVDQPGIDDTETMIETALARLEMIDQWRANQIRERLKEMKDPALTKILDLNTDQVALGKIADANILIAPADGEDCLELQGAFNKVNPGPMQFKYAFISQYLNKMSDQDRAGLYLHEALYNLEASLGATNSDSTREQVRAMSSNAFSKFTLITYATFINNNSKRPSVTDRFGSYELFSLKEDYVSSGKLLEDTTYSLAAIQTKKGESTTHKSYILPSTGRKGARILMAEVKNENGATEVAVAEGSNVHAPGFITNVEYISEHTVGKLHIQYAALKNIRDGHSPAQASLIVDYPNLQPAPFHFFPSKRCSLFITFGTKETSLSWTNIPHEMFARSIVLDSNGNVQHFELGDYAKNAPSIRAMNNPNVQVISVVDTNNNPFSVQMKAPVFRSKLLKYPVLSIDFNLDGSVKNWDLTKKERI
jgi:hypothetical protein